MEPQEYFLSKGCFKSKCYIPIIGIFLIAFFTTIGIIIGAAVAETILEAIASLIVLAIIFGILSIILIILLYCNRRNKYKDCGY